jgi:hypothetical protein
VNYLEICRAARKECGIALNTTALPTTVLNQVGQLGNVVRWVADVWDEIQGEQKWSFMWEAATVTVAANTNATATTLTERRWEKESAHIGDSFLSYMPWVDFRLTFPTIPTGAAGQQPTVWTIRPDRAFAVNIKPTADVVIEVERYINPTRLAADTDTPSMPENLHMLIMWGAVIKYAGEAEAGVRRATAVEEYARLHQQLLDLCLPTTELGGPLA